MIKSLLTKLKKKKKNSGLKDFYLDWIETLNTSLFPQLTQSLSSSSPSPQILATHVNTLHTHFRSLFSALDLASNDDVSLLLYPDFHNTVEKPFLWFGHFHPYIFTHLLRSFIKDDDSDENENGSGLEFVGNSCNLVMAWKNLENSLGHNVEQMECTLKLMVPSIVGRARDSQASFVAKLGVGWAKEGAGFKVDDVVGQVVDELTCVYLDANRLRRSILADILGSLNVYQAALFLHGLSKFYLGFRDSKLISQFSKSKLVLD